MRPLALALAVLMLVLPACGGEDAGAEPQAWAAEVCGSVGSWLQDVQQSSEEIGETARAADNLEEVRREFVSFFDGLTDRTDEMLADIQAAGTPDVEEGEAIAEDLQSSIEPLRDALADAREQARRLPVDDPQAFAREAAAAGQAVERSATDVQEALNRLDRDYDAPELQQAFEEEEACADL